MRMDSGTKRTWKRWAGMALTAGLLCLPTLAETETSRGALSFFFENDVFAGTDQHYTNGIMIRWLSPEFNSKTSSADSPTWLQSLVNNLSPLKGEKYRHALSASIGQKMFTPEDLTSPDPGPDTQPYAGVSYLEIGFQSRSTNRLDSYAFSLGIIGEHSYAGSLQILIHRLFDFTTPMGWKNQLKDEFILNLYYETISRRARLGGKEGFGLDLFSNLGAGVGNGFVGAGGGLMVRAGLNLPFDFGPSLMRPRGEAIQKHEKFGIDFYIAANGSYVLHDITLDGSFNTDIPNPPRRSIYEEISAGIEVFAGRSKLVSSTVIWNKRLQTQLRPHIYGSINVSYCF